MGHPVREAHHAILAREHRGMGGLHARRRLGYDAFVWCASPIVRVVGSQILSAAGGKLCA